MNGASRSSVAEIARAICCRQGFTFVESVGKGAFKKVFSVKDKIGKRYALKIIRGPIQDERTRREVEALEKCDHLNIGKLLKVDIYTSGGVDYTFTIEEFLDGGTLTQCYEKRGCLDDGTVFAIGKGLISAVGHIAELGLVHRDIKPDNIMFRSDGEAPVLVDFNLVRDLSAVSLTQSWLNRGPGTPYFASPEQLNNEKRLIDWRTDQFALGVTLFFVRFGMHPYQHPGEAAFSQKTVERVAARGPRSKEVLQRFDETAIVCLEKMTRTWPVERFRRPAELQKVWG
jgi:serine/threonine protein kinase